MPYDTTHNAESVVQRIFAVCNYQNYCSLKAFINNIIKRIITFKIYFYELFLKRGPNLCEQKTWTRFLIDMQESNPVLTRTFYISALLLAGTKVIQTHNLGQGQIRPPIVYSRHVVCCNKMPHIK